MASRSRQILGEPRDWAVRLTAGVAVGVFLGVIGPFGSFAAPLPVRVATWTTGVCTGVVLFSLAVRAARRVGARLALPAWFSTGAAVLAACLPLSLFVGLLFNARYLREGGVSAALEFYGDVLLIAAPFTAAVILLDGRRAAPTPAPPPPEPTSTAPSLPPPEPVAAVPASLLDRLPPRLGRDLVALQMEDHYVRAHTPLGSDLLLMPLGQAVEALAAVEGLRVHRSWWVARAAVEGEAWEGRNLRLRLRGGLEAPVARASIAPLRAAGWLTPAGPAD